MTDIHVIRNQEAVKENKKRELINKLSELTIPFPIKSICSTCDCAWAIPDLAHMERVWSEYHDDWRVGFCCPNCHRTNTALKQRDLEEFYLLKEPDDYYGSINRFDKYQRELNALSDKFRKAPLWLRVYRWALHFDWKIQSREKPIYLNDKRFKTSLDIERVDVVESDSEDELEPAIEKE